MAKRILIMLVCVAVSIFAIFPLASGAEDSGTRTVIRLETDNPLYKPLCGLKIESFIGSRFDPCFSLKVTLGKEELGYVRVTPGKKPDERRIESDLLPEGAVTVSVADAGRTALDTALKILPNSKLSSHFDLDYISSMLDEVLAFDGRKLSRFEPLKLFDFSYIGIRRVSDFYVSVSDLLDSAKETDTPKKKAGFSTADIIQTVGNEISFSVDLDKTFSLNLGAEEIEKTLLPFAEDTDWFFNLPQAESFTGLLRGYLEKRPDAKLPMLVSFDRSGRMAGILIGRACPGAAEDIPFAFSTLQRAEDAGKMLDLYCEYDTYLSSGKDGGEINRYIYAVKENIEEPISDHDSCFVTLVPAIGATQIYYHFEKDPLTGITVTALDTASDSGGKEKRGGIKITEKPGGALEILLDLIEGKPVKLIGTVEKVA